VSLTAEEIAGMIDLSAVRADNTTDDIRRLAETAERYGCLGAFCLPCHTPLLKSLLPDTPRILTGGIVGFPSGATTSYSKAAEAGELVSMGCDELDMVINVGLLRSGAHDYVRDDIRAVVEAAAGLPVKVILECHYLTDEEICAACELCIEAGAGFVKTGTGWAPTGATVENIELIKSCVGDRIGIKAAGGVRDLETLEAMHGLGATRFGVGVTSAAPILEQASR
jgi:deoxyribose-phosphate aldolase